MIRTSVPVQSLGQSSFLFIVQAVFRPASGVKLTMGFDDLQQVLLSRLVLGQSTVEPEGKLCLAL